MTVKYKCPPWGPDLENKIIIFYSIHCPFLIAPSVFRCNTTKEFSIAFYVKLKKNELSYRIHLKFNLSDTHVSWKGYLIGRLTPKINIHLMAYKRKQTV
jgi:hypothetical protein